MFGERCFFKQILVEYISTLNEFIIQCNFGENLIDIYSVVQLEFCEGLCYRYKGILDKINESLKLL